MKIFVVTLVGLLVTGLIAALLVIYSGEFNVAATQPHTAVGRWVLNTTMENSVKEHAEQIEAPALTPDMAERGFTHFDAHCKTCHGAPGVEPAHIGKGLRPRPPDLSQAVAQWQPPELFWIVKHGIRMTGMPAWDPQYSDEQLWDLVAFTRQLPEISASKYQQLSQSQETASAQSSSREKQQSARWNDSEQEAAQHVVTMTDTLKFTPAKIRIRAGESILWRNTSGVVHTVTADPSLAADKSHAAIPASAEVFNSGNIEPGATYQRRFEVAGKYKYFCIPHEAAGMVGEIIVEESNEAASTSAGK